MPYDNMATAQTAARASGDVMHTTAANSYAMTAIAWGILAVADGLNNVAKAIREKAL